MDKLKEIHSELLAVREELIQTHRKMPEFRGEFAIRARMKWRQENIKPLETRILQLERDFVKTVHDSEYYDLFVEYESLTGSDW